ncbi:MAG: MCE family protein [Desulfobacterales bacterium]|nr:MCE family protein [Desulfobacterales bacterium]
MAKLSVEAKVGFFVIIGIIILSYMSMKLGKLSFKRDSGYILKVFFDSASGLAEDVPVEIAGVEVGRVQTISLMNGKALVILKINSDTKISKNVKAIIRTKGILGDKYIELVQGTEQAPFMKPGDQILNASPATDIDTLMKVLEEVAININKLTGSFANVMGGEEGEASLRTIFENVKEMVETLNLTVQKNNTNVTQIISNLSDFSKKLKNISDTHSDDIRSIITNIHGASEEIEQLISGINKITTKLNQGKGSLGKLINEEETVNNLNDMLADLKNITEKINSGKGTIGKLIKEDETADRINTTLSGINDYIRKQETFRTYLNYRGEYLFNSGDVKSYLSLRIQPKEDKYYLFNVVDDPRGKDSITDITRTINDSTTTERIVETERDGLKFSAQIAKRYYDIGFRGGLFESTGGIGIDYYFFDDHLMLSMEAFDFDPDRNFHLKFKADYTPFNYIYITSGLDDFISDEGNESFFIGAGINFSDEDIKTILSNIPLPTN